MTIQGKIARNLLLFIRKALYSFSSLAIGTIAFALLFYAAKAITAALSLPVPSGLLGLLLVLVCLLVFKRIPKVIDFSSDTLIKHMSLFFVPAVVSVIEYKDMLSKHWIGMSMAIVIASLAAYIVTLLIAQLTLKGVSK